MIAALVSSLLIPFLSLSIPCFPGQYCVSLHLQQQVAHRSLGPRVRHSPYCPVANLQSCCSVPPHLCNFSQKEMRRHGEVCVTPCVWMLLQRRVWKAASGGNSSGYCRPPRRSMNRAGGRQLTRAMLWSTQQSQPLTFMSAKFTQKCFFLNPPQAIKLWSRLISCHISFLKSELACADTRETYNIFTRT